ncbi:hypothetical protein IEE84_09605 [Psychrobacter sp. 28M-43]|uniref:hypothetical protein n=1 Tax=Psychrobacter sp. 28M-43 TaxID=2772254 RepID=UPI00168D1D01|nr:hypothetical protein [Psychrobacter sp. 28M-43]QOD12143.1 hypothetical protein IEE84_09605 [Psychrobacter sp. 28M-43]
MENTSLNVGNVKIMLKKQIELDNFCDDTALFWQGYLFALLEFSLIEGDNELYTLLPQVGNQECYDFLLGEPSDIELD